MKRIPFCVTLFLLLPLMTAFSQAATLAAAECSHCSQEWFVQSNCCDTPVAETVSDCCKEKAKQPERCPHSGLCQGEKSIPPVVSTISVTDFSAAAVSFSFLGEKKRDVPEKNYVARPPPLQSDPLIYLFHCTFLI